MKLFSRKVMSRMKGWVVEAAEKGKSGMGKALTGVGALLKNIGEGEEVEELDKDELKKKLQEKKGMRASKRNNTVRWEKDAHDGQLSYSRMVHRVALKHPMRQEGQERTNYPICATHTGWYCLCKSWRKAEIRELGIGMSIYFKFLKYFMFVFLLMTALSIPSLYIYYHGDQVGDFTQLTLKQKLSAFSLGNIGQRKCSFYNRDL